MNSYPAQIQFFHCELHTHITLNHVVMYFFKYGKGLVINIFICVTYSKIKGRVKSLWVDRIYCKS
ncbi:hypothetical protein HanXRQr2_Chr06g0239241 [Helianthus annuus]|uniref:Uncharacterized protein n=1 Tax=Helianthus annuus TaxID=4232 RepID=A0A9K3IPP8_HELAN|nr:hypothetical protein HanXRQr2_Chr06g0239241 [Helianthus annuus]KAJ0913733.1 hypothetical protein HanPSC8_Chr06g0230711 [Helianthus annuus]